MIVLALSDVARVVLIALGAPIGLLVVAHALLPLVMKRAVWIGEATIEEIPLDAPDLPRSEQDEMARYGAELEALGYAFGALIRVSGHAATETVYQAIYIAPDRRTLAAATARSARLKGQNGEDRFWWKRFLEFATEYPDGVQVLTNNLDAPPNTCHLFRLIRVPSVRAAARLASIHSAAVQTYGVGPGIRIEGDRWWIGVVQRSLHAVVSSEVLAGTMRKSDDGRWRLTWKGAFLRTWQVLWPWGLLRRMRAVRERNAVVRRAGV